MVMRTGGAIVPFCLNKIVLEEMGITDPQPHGH